MKAAIFLADGFEECEGLIPIDLLRRAGIEIDSVSVTKYMFVTGSRGVSVKTDKVWEEIDPSSYDVLILPGGKKGKENLEAFEPLKDALLEHWNAMKLTCAICAAPAILGHMGLLEGKDYTCFPDFNEDAFGGTWRDVPALKDGILITGRGMGCSIEFAREIIRTVAPEKLASVEAGIQYVPIA